MKNHNKDAQIRQKRCIQTKNNIVTADYRIKKEAVSAKVGNDLLKQLKKRGLFLPYIILSPP
jgi:hypothetical protein